jgi:hypothetical protein
MEGAAAASLLVVYEYDRSTQRNMAKTKIAKSVLQLSRYEGIAGVPPEVTRYGMCRMRMVRASH